MLKSLIQISIPQPERQYTCEACNKVTPESQTYSLALVYRMPGPGITAFQCPAEQHFACSHECAVAAMQACLKEHIEPIQQALQKQVSNP